MSNYASASASASARSIGFIGLLFITFLVLKLTHVINWSWWWVTAPLWGGVLMWVLFLLIVCVVVNWLFNR